MLFGRDPSQPDIDGFNDALMPRFQATLNETAIKPASHCIPSLALWLTFPDQHFFLRPDLYNRANRTLTGSVAEGQGEVMTTAYYLSGVEFATELRDQIAELNPRDMIDVQGFCWGVFSRSRIWFGGKSYGGTKDMLPEFLARQIYAIRFARRDEIVELLKDVPSLDKEARTSRRTLLEEKCGGVKDSERKAVLNFFDLLSAPGSTLEPKTVRDCIGRFYHRLNDDYQPMHGLARFLIEHSGPGTDVGGHEFLPFSVNMPNLFEAFVAEWLKQNLPRELKVDVQYHVRLDANAPLSFRIDLVLRKRETGEAIAVLDTKYKLNDLPTESDIQQVVSYAVEMDVRRAYLLYPFCISEPIQARVGNVDVETLGFDLEKSIEESGKELISSLSP